LEHWEFEFRICFVLRISDFSQGAGVPLTTHDSIRKAAKPAAENPAKAGQMQADDKQQAADVIRAAEAAVKAAESAQQAAQEALARLRGDSSRQPHPGQGSRVARAPQRRIERPLRRGGRGKDHAIL